MEEALKAERKYVEQIYGIPKQQTCSLTQPNDLIHGCIENVKSVATDPGAVIGSSLVAGTGAGLAKFYTKANPISTVFYELGGEGIGICVAGIVNTALKNCQETLKDKDNTSLPQQTLTTAPASNARKIHKLIHNPFKSIISQSFESSTSFNVSN